MRPRGSPRSWRRRGSRTSPRRRARLSSERVKQATISISLERLMASASTSDHQPMPSAATRNGRESCAPVPPTLIGALIRRSAQRTRSAPSLARPGLARVASQCLRKSGRPDLRGRGVAAEWFWSRDRPRPPHPNRLANGERERTEVVAHYRPAERPHAQFVLPEAALRIGDQRAISAFTRRSKVAGLRSALGGIDAAELAQPLLHRRIVERLVERGGELVDHLLRRALRREDAGPDAHLVVDRRPPSRSARPAAPARRSAAETT